MILNKIKTMVFAFMLIISTNAQAKLQEFEEVFTGKFLNTENIESDFYDDSTTLKNGDVTLTMYYQVFNDLPVNYPGFGTFTRTDAMGSFSGNFLFYLSLNPDVISFTGFLDMDKDAALPNTGAYQYAWARGEADGTITSQGDMTLKIKWQIATPDVFVPVPEPHMSWLLSFGLVMLCLRHKKTIQS